MAGDWEADTGVAVAEKPSVAELASKSSIVAPPASSTAFVPPPRPAALESVQAAISGLMPDLQARRKRVEEAEQAAIQAKKATLTPAIERVKASAATPTPPPPSEAPEPPMPDVSPRAFLGGEGKNALQQIVAGLGLLVTAAAGARRAPAQALGALTGAMTGWAEGDAERASREWHQYEGLVAKMNRENQKAVKAWERAMVLRGGNQQDAKLLMEGALAEAGLSDMAAEYAGKDYARIGQDLTMAQSLLTKMDSVYRTDVETAFRRWEASARQRHELTTEAETSRHHKATEGLLAKKAAMGEFDDEQIDFMAGQALAGDTSVFTNVGRGVQGPDNLKRLRKAIQRKADEKGITPEELAARNAEFSGLKAGERALGTRSANIGMAMAEAKQLIPALRDASARVDRTSIPLVNRFLMAANMNAPFDEEMAGNVAQLGVALNSFINIYARAMNPQGVPTVSDKEHARELLIKSWSDNVLNKGLDQIMIELEAAEKSPDIVRKSLRESVTGKAETPATGLPSGIPPGSKQIGTSQGKPVYQSPDGKKWVVE